jgi:molybdopterin-binding protein
VGGVMKTIKVKCEIEEGMFQSEVNVKINTGYQVVESLISKNLVNEDFIELKIDDIEGNDMFVIIPGDITKGERIVKFKKPISAV